MTLFFQQLVNGLALGSVYGVFAIGFGLVFGTMNILNLAQGVIATSGALITVLVLRHTGLPLLVALVAGPVGAGLIGVLVDQLGFQPLRRRTNSFLPYVITSIGFWIILGNVALVVTDGRFLALPPDSVPTFSVELAGLFIPIAQLVTIGALVVLTVAMYLAVQRSSPGAAVRAVGWDQAAASLGGVNPRLVIILTSFVAATIAGSAGVLTAISTNNVSHTLGEGLMLRGFAAVVVGGFGDVRGAALGGLIIGVSEVLGAQYVSNSFRDALSFGLLILFLLLRPQGIFGGPAIGRA